MSTKTKGGLPKNLGEGTRNLFVGDPLDGVVKVDKLYVKGLAGGADAPEGYGLALSADDEVKSLVPVDFFEIRMMEEFQGFGYGVKVADSAQIVKVNLSDATETNFGNPVPVGNLQNIAFMPDGTCFAEGHSGDNFYKLYRTTDNGLSWFLSSTQEISRVYSARNRGIVWFKGYVYYAEYNVNLSRVPGSTNDRVRVMKSPDNGISWQDVVVWNTNGQSQVRHLHGIVVSKDGNSAYIMSGDDDSESVVIKYDGVTYIPDNTPVLNITSVTGLPALAGRQAFRCNDLVEDNGLLYWYSDAVTMDANQADNIGIFKCNTNLDISSFERISSAGADIYGLGGRLGVLLPTGEICFQVNQEAATEGAMYTPIILSNKNKTEWKVVGAYKGKASQTYYYRRCFFNIGNNMYMSNDNGSGKSELTTVAFKVSDKIFMGDYETVNITNTLHPVYWLDPVNGSDSNNGWSPRSPMRTIKHALESNKIPYGGRLMLPAGNYEIEGITPASESANLNGDPTDFLELSGEGASNTKIAISNSSGTSNMFFIGGAGSKRLKLSDLTIYSKKSSSVIISSNPANGGSNHAATLVRCFLDGNGNRSMSNMLVSSGAPISGYGCVVQQTNGISLSCLYTRDSASGGSMNFYFENSLFKNSARYVDSIRGGNQAYFRGCKFVNPSSEVFRFRLDGNLSLTAINCEFYSTANRNSVIARNETGSALPLSIFDSVTGFARGEEAAFDVYCVKSYVKDSIYNIMDYVI